MIHVVELIWNVLQTNANNTVRSRIIVQLIGPLLFTIVNNTLSGELDR